MNVSLKSKLQCTNAKCDYGFRVLGSSSIAGSK